MTLTRKDAMATVFVVLAVAVFFAYRQAWGVPLIGDSIRWAAGAVALLGILSCSMQEPGKIDATRMVGILLGVAALALIVTTLVFASLTLFSVLTADVVALWLVSTMRHTVVVQHHRPIPH
jgi:hypothetical protein